MMIFVRLFFEFFKAGLFAIGGGMVYAVINADSSEGAP